MGYKEIFYPESRFGEFSDIDMKIVFYCRVNSLLDPSFTVLDVGCGLGRYGEDIRIRRELRVLKPKVRRVIGLDIDEKARENPFIHDFFLLMKKGWPIPNDSVDLILCDNVIEYMEDPGIFFSESARVLKYKGYVCLKTTNLLSYFGLLANMIPERYHQRILEIALLKKQTEPYPVFYRCNTVRKIRRALVRHGFDSVVYGYEGEPNHLSFSRLAYRIGVLHQKFAPKMFKPTIFAFGQKKDDG